MGLLTFLTRKSSDQKKYASPYNTTVASLPPMRGAYPVAGNGPNVLETFQKTHPKFRQAQQASPESFASAPTVPRIRDDDIERPQTAPSLDKSAWPAFSRTDSPTGPPVSLHTANIGKPRVELCNPPAKRPKRPYKLPAKEFEPIAFIKPTPAFAHGRTDSIRSGDSSSSRGFVDILEAQSAISRVDFYHRLEAAGARDYGEDVADRNIGENGIDLNSPEARAFYRASHHSRAASPAVSSTQHEVEEDPKPRSKKRHSTGASSYKKSKKSAMNEPYPARTSSFVPFPPPVPKIETIQGLPFNHGGPTSASRRKSLHSYVAASSATTWSSSSASKGRLAESQPNGLPPTLKSKSKEISTAENSDAVEDSKRTLSLGRQIPSSKKSCESIILAKNKTPELGPRLIRVEAMPVQSQEPRPKVPKASRRETVSYGSKSKSSQHSSKRFSLQSLQSTNARQARPPSPKTDLNYSRRDLGSTTDLHDSVNTRLQLQDMQSPRVESFHRRPHSRDGHGLEYYYPRSHSLVSSSTKSTRRFDTEEPIPERTNSLGHWSIDSTTATISSLSSNPFRPQSRHTANTSIDLVPLPKGANMSHDSLHDSLHNSLASDSFRTASESRAPTALFSTPTKSMHKSNNSTNTFNIDNYISSDEDREIQPQSRGEGEEHLLFHDSTFGFGGAQLPGIPGIFDTASQRPGPPLSPPSSHTPSFSRQVYLPTGFQNSDFRLPGITFPRSEPNPHEVLSRLRFLSHHFDDSEDKEELSDTEREDSDDDDDDDDDISFDIPLSRPSTAASLRYLPRNNRFTGQDVIEEEKESDKIDVSTAIKMRKAAKRNILASGSSVARRGGNRAKAVAVIRAKRMNTGDVASDVE